MPETKKVKRSEIRTFLNTTPSENTEKWSLVGNGQTTGTRTYDASTTEETYIINDSATTNIDSYSVSMDNEMKCIYGDEVYNYINGLRRNRAINDDAQTEVLNIDIYDKTTEGAYFAEKCNCTIAISSYGGDGGVTPTIGYTINEIGDPVKGTATITDGKVVFTPSV